MAAHGRHVFDRCGIAALSDLDSPGWRNTFDDLQGAQTEFLARDHLFRSAGYNWPRDALHNWSRVWEYPFVHHHLARWASAGTPTARIADFGAGVTFFPFVLARLGFHVTAIDNNPVCTSDLGKAVAAIPHAPGTVTPLLSAGSRIPLPDAGLDGLYSISVLEHIPDVAPVIDEIHRILKPGGLFVLTIDLDLRGDSAIGIAPRRALRDRLFERFDLVFPEESIHPADMLHSLCGPCPMPIGPRQRIAGFVVDRINRYVPGVKLAPPPPARLAVEAWVWKKKDGRPGT